MLVQDLEESLSGSALGVWLIELRDLRFPALLRSSDSVKPEIN